MSCIILLYTAVAADTGALVLSFNDNSPKRQVSNYWRVCFSKKSFEINCPKGNKVVTHAMPESRQRFKDGSL